jgi:hypothetical protein
MTSKASQFSIQNFSREGGAKQEYHHVVTDQRPVFLHRPRDRQKSRVTPIQCHAWATHLQPQRADSLQSVADPQSLDSYPQAFP